MKWLSYTWLIVRNLFIIFLTVALLSVAYNEFDRIVIALLALVYISINSGVSTLGMGILEIATKQRDQFLKMIKAVGSNEFDDEYTQEELKEENKKMSEMKVKFFINSIFTYIMWVIVVWNLISNLIS